MQVKKIGPDFFVSGQLLPTDLETLESVGIKCVVCNRPDSEEVGQPCFSEIAKLARFYNINAVYMPIISMGDLSDDKVLELKALISSTKGAVLAYCRSGARSTKLYEAL